MKNLKQTFHYIVIILAPLFVLLPRLASAGSVTRTERIELDCCKNCHTIKVFPSSSDTQYSITIEEIRVDNRSELTKIINDTKEYVQRHESELQLPQKTQEESMVLSKNHIYISAKCSSDSSYTNLWPVGTNLSCNKRDELVIIEQLFEPEFKENTNTYCILTLKTTKDVPKNEEAFI